MLTSIIKAAAGTLGLVFAFIWIVSLVNWDGKVHCDKSECENCVYYPDCPHAKEEQTK